MGKNDVTDLKVSILFKWVQTTTIYIVYMYMYGAGKLVLLCSTCVGRDHLFSNYR